MQRICVLMVLPDLLCSQTLLGKLVAAQVMAALRPGSAAGVPRSAWRYLRGRFRESGRVVALHAVVARQPVHDGLVERVAHVRDAECIGWERLDGQLNAAVASVPGWPVPRYAGITVTTFPTQGPNGLRWRIVQKTWRAVEARLLQWCRSWLRANSGNDRRHPARDVVCISEKDGLQ